MAADVKISLIVPTYNVEDYLPHCLDSVLEQTFKDIEIIIVDGNSTDRTVAIAQSYADKGIRTRILNQDPLKPGVMVAKKTGYMAASGNYIAFCDADDTLMPDALQTLYDKAIAEDADLVVGEIVYRLRKHEISCSCQSIKKNKTYIEAFLDKEAENRMTGKLYRRTLLQNADIPAIPRMALGEDWLFSYLLAGNINRWCRIKHIVYSYYQHDGSITYSQYSHQSSNYAELWFEAMWLIWSKYGGNPVYRERVTEDLSLLCTQLLMRGFTLPVLTAAAGKYQMQWLMDPDKLRVSSKKTIQ